MTKNYLLKFVLIISVIGSLIAISCRHKKNSEFRLELINTSIDTWGYMILSNGKPIIYQEFIPCVDGNIPFSTKEDARKVGMLVLEKLQNNQLPSCTITELKEHKVLPN